jgi:hypothetical protein
MMSQRARPFVIVRRGEASLFRTLQEDFGQGPDPTPVIWDRRIRDRRVIIQDVAVERRRGERRGPADVTLWSRRGFVVVRVDRPGADTREEPGAAHPAGRGPRGGPDRRGLGG